MSEELKHVQVKIGSMSYQLVASGDPANMAEIAAQADELIQKVLRKNPRLPMPAATVLALVNAVDNMQRALEQMDHAYQDRDKALIQAEEIKAELARLREQFWETKKDLLYYRNLCEIFEEKLTALATQPVELDKGKGPRSKIAEASKRPLDRLQTTFDDLADPDTTEDQ